MWKLTTNEELVLLAVADIGTPADVSSISLRLLRAGADVRDNTVYKVLVRMMNAGCVNAVVLDVDGRRGVYQRIVWTLAEFGRFSLEEAELTRRKLRKKP